MKSERRRLWAWNARRATLPDMAQTAIRLIPSGELSITADCLLISQKQKSGRGSNGPWLIEPKQPGRRTGMLGGSIF